MPLHLRWLYLLIRLLPGSAIRQDSDVSAFFPFFFFQICMHGAMTLDFRPRRSPAAARKANAVELRVSPCGWKESEKGGNRGPVCFCKTKTRRSKTESRWSRLLDRSVVERRPLPVMQDRTQGI